MLVAKPSTRSAVRPTAVLLSLALLFSSGLVFVALLLSVPDPVSYAIGTEADARVAFAFWSRQSGAEGPYRWTMAESRLQIYGYERFSTLLQLRIHGPAVNPPHTFKLGLSTSTAQISATAQPEWRVYHIFAPQKSASSTLVARITSPVLQPGAHDMRWIGIATSMLGVQALGNPAPGAVLLRTLLAGALMLLGMLGCGRLVGYRRAALAAPIIGLAFIVASLAAPIQMSYWLPAIWTTVLLLLGLLSLPAGLRYLQTRVYSPGWGWVGGAVAISGAALLALGSPALTAPGGLLLVAGGLGAAAGPASGAPGGLSRAGRISLLGVAVLVAAGARLFRLDVIPFGLWRDEARYGLVALRILNDPDYRPVYLPGGIDYPALLMYLTGFIIKLIGIKIESVRLVAALAGTLTPVAIYAFGRRLVGVPAAVVAALLVGFSAWHIAISRISFVAVLDPLFTMIGLALLWSALSMPIADRRRWIWFGCAGVAFGLALYTYHTARVLPLLVLLLLFTVLGRSWSRWRSQIIGLALMTLITTVMILPLASYAIAEFDSFNLRMRQTSIITEPERQEVPIVAALDQNLNRYLLMWHVRGEPNARHYLPGRPMLDPISGAMFLIGVLSLLVRRRSPAERFLLAWLIIELIPALLAEGAPHAVRAVGAIAPALLLASLGFQHIWQMLGSRLRSSAVAGLVGVAAVVNLGLYFGYVPYSPVVWEKFYTADTAMADYARSAAPQSQVLVPLELLETDVGAYLLYGIPVQPWDATTRLSQPLPGGTRILVPAQPTEPQRQWVAQNLAQITPAPQESYPGTMLPTFWVYTLP